MNTIVTQFEMRIRHFVTGYFFDSRKIRFIQWKNQLFQLFLYVMELRKLFGMKRQ